MVQDALVKDNRDELEKHWFTSRCFLLVPLRWPVSGSGWEGVCCCSGSHKLDGSLPFQIRKPGNWCYSGTCSKHSLWVYLKENLISPVLLMFGQLAWLQQ